MIEMDSRFWHRGDSESAATHHLWRATQMVLVSALDSVMRSRRGCQGAPQVSLIVSVESDSGALGGPLLDGLRTPAGGAAEHPIRWRCLPSRDIRSPCAAHDPEVRRDLRGCPPVRGQLGGRFVLPAHRRQATARRHERVRPNGAGRRAWPFQVDPSKGVRGRGAHLPVRTRAVRPEASVTHASRERQSGPEWP
jgi:hypothetical protein